MAYHRPRMQDFLYWAYLLKAMCRIEKTDALSTREESL